MKQTIFLPLTLMCVAVLALAGCAGEEDDIFSASAAERLNESSAKYSARLEAQPNGWAMQYYPTYQDESPYGSGYLILMDFNPDFSVRVAMDNVFTSNTFACDTSVWQVITDNGPVLSFNTYNYCMHAFSDPEDIPWTSDSEQSEGCGGDYEFIVVDAPEDASYMMLKGKKRGTYNLLTPIEEGVDYQEYLADVKAFHNKMFSSAAPVGNFIHFGDTIYNMEDAEDGLPSIFPLGADKITYENFNPFLITKRGNDYYLRFRDAFKRDDMEGTLQEMRYDVDSDKFICTDNPLFTIEGFPVDSFFTSYPQQGLATRNYWSLAKAAVMSEKVKGYMDAIDAEFSQLKDNKNKAYVFNGIRFSYDSKNGSYQWDVYYKPGSSSATTVSFHYDVSPVGASQLKFDYNKPATASAEAVYASTPSIVNMLNVLSQTFKIEPAETAFDVTKVKFTSTTDSDIWFVMTI